VCTTNFRSVAPLLLWRAYAIGGGEVLTGKQNENRFASVLKIQKHLCF